MRNVFLTWRKHTYIQSNKHIFFSYDPLFIRGKIDHISCFNGRCSFDPGSSPATTGDQVRPSTSPQTSQKSIFSCFNERCFFDPRSVLLTPKVHLRPQVIKLEHHQVLNPCKNRYLHVFIEDILLTRHKRTDRQTNPFYFFRTTLRSVEGIELLKTL